MHQNRLQVRSICMYGLGVGLAALLARLILRLFAARPDNPVFAALFSLTAPPQALIALDIAQPHFGATLELSTLALICTLLIVLIMLRCFWPNHVAHKGI